MIDVELLKEQGICPTCYNLEHGGVYEDFSERLIYEDEVLWCFLEEKPRSVGHTIILLKNIIMICHIYQMKFVIMFLTFLKK